MDLDVEVTEVVFVGHRVDARDSVYARTSISTCRAICHKSQATETVNSHGSAIRRSVSFTMRLGKDMSARQQTQVYVVNRGCCVSSRHSLLEAVSLLIA